VSEAISPKQVQLVHLAKRDLGLSDEEYREIIVSMFPEAWSGSCKELTYEQASKFIDRLKDMGFQIRKRRKRKPAGMATLVTRQQLARIEHLEANVSWRLRDGARRFARKVIGKERPATTREAAKLIEALKGVKKTQERKANS
jgi:phage gp16-like protein